jgi:hypothetical protein
MSSNKTAMNPQLIKRVGSHLLVNLGDTVVVKPEDNVEELEAKGFHFLKVVSGDDVIMHRRSKQSDGYVRETSTEWTKDAQLFVYETDQLKWASLVGWWFENALKDTEYMAQIERVYGRSMDVNKTMRKAQIHMESLRPKKSGKAGARRGDIHTWLINSNKSYFASAASNRG